MCDVIVWHGQDRDLCNRTFAALYDTCTLIESSKFTVQISRITFTGRNLTFGGRNLTHCLAERSDIRQDNKDVHAFFKSKIFCGGQCDLRSQKSFYDRIIGKVQKHNYVVRCAALFESTAEKFSDIVFNTHCSKHDCKVLIGIITQRSLLYDLCGKFVMRETVSGKYWKFLTTNQSSQTIDRGDSCVDIVSRVFTFHRIQRKSVDIKAYLRSDLAQTVDRLSDTIEGTSEDLLGKTDLHWMPCKACVCIAQGHVVCSLKNLDNSFVLIDFYDTADLLCSVIHVKFYDLFIGCVFYPFQNYQRAVYLA